MTDSTIALIEPPERINVAQDSDGFWTCREAVIGSQEYVRADIERDWRYEALRLKAELTTLLERCEKAEALLEQSNRMLVDEANTSLARLERAEEAEARVKELEKRNDMLLERFSDKCTENEELRDEIATAIRDRDEAVSWHTKSEAIIVNYCSQLARAKAEFNELRKSTEPMQMDGEERRARSLITNDREG